ncbi:S8 family serine peptidase [Flindersiella endophytica]
MVTSAGSQTRTKTLLGALLGGIALVLGTVVAPDGSAEPPPPPSPPALTWASPQPGDAGAHTVTLITGDVVHFERDTTGKPSYSVTPAARPRHEQVTFQDVPLRDGFLVLPSDAVPYVTSGALDRSLFDVEALIEDGYADDAAALPVIVDHAGSARALPAGRTARTLRSLNATALDLERGAAKRFWAGLRPERRGDPLTAGVRKVWLDRRMRASLDQSVPLVGASQAWALGLDGKGTTVAILDSGIDTTHPDLTGKVAAGQSFVDGEPGYADHFGHGTHVASTIAGSAAASDGKYKGVAPAATLLAGKVLDDSGNGSMSSVIAGMEWAARQGADVVNLSLGGPVTDGTDPASAALNELSEQYGTLFVVAAGNNGEEASVSTPGAADAALTVGAVDKVTGTSIAEFSGRGPRYGDGAVKPNLVAPGVGIIAARAAGTDGPEPVGEFYTRASGTSMATPHVAGAAAILAQQHPDWTAQQLKDVLVSTARPLDASTFEAGAGRLDVARAVAQNVHGPAAVDFGEVPPGDGAITREVTLTNDRATAVDLTMRSDLRRLDGGAAPAAAIRLEPAQLAVPAHGKATVRVTLDPSGLDRTVYGGHLTAGGDATLSIPIGLYAGRTAGVHVEVLGGHGAPLPLVTTILQQTDFDADPRDPFAQEVYVTSTDEQGAIDATVQPGTYDVFAFGDEVGFDARRYNALYRFDLAVTTDTRITLDGRDTAPLRPAAPEPTDFTNSVTTVQHLLPGAAESPFFRSPHIAGGNEIADVYVSRSPGVRQGRLRIEHQWTLEQRALRTVSTSGGLGLNPAYDSASVRRLVTSTRTYPLVFAGQGEASDFDGIDATGRFALVALRPPPEGTPHRWEQAYYNQLGQAITNAEAAGAAGLLYYFDLAGAIAHPIGSAATIRLGLSQAEGARLRAQLAGGPLSLTLQGSAEPPSVYHLFFEHGSAPASPPSVAAGSLARAPISYHADKAGVPVRERWVGLHADSPPIRPEIWNGQPQRAFTGPVTTTHLVGPVRADVTWLREVRQGSRLPMLSYQRFATAGTQPAEHWFKAPLLPGAADVPAASTRAAGPVVPACSLCRDGDRFVPADQWLDSDPRHFADLSPALGTVELFEDDAEVRLQDSDPRSFLVSSPAAADYRVAARDVPPELNSVRLLSSQVSTEWSFGSQAPDESRNGSPDGFACSFGTSCAFQPALQVRYDVPLDLLNRAPAGQAVGFDLTAAVHGAAPERPAVTAARLQFSVDDGATWQDAGLSALGGGRYRATVEHPALPQTNGYVSLRFTASDTAGGSLTQTVTRAYALE